MNQEIDTNKIINPTVEHIQNIHKIVQALFSDGVFYFSEDTIHKTEERKNSILCGISLIKDKLSQIEQVIG